LPAAPSASLLAVRDAAHCCCIICLAFPQVRNLQNEITKKCAPPCATTDAVFYAGTGLLLCRSEDKVPGHTTRTSTCMRFHRAVVWICCDMQYIIAAY
jgi:hypothetical protein